jgi:hypothetical protein
MKLKAQVALLILVAHLAPAQVKKTLGKRDDGNFTNVSYPQPQYQVVTSEQVKSIYLQQQSLIDIRERLGGIEQSINEVKTDVKSLKETDIVVNFILGIVKLLVPGLIITAFGIWFTKRKPHGRVPAI